MSNVRSLQLDNYERVPFHSQKLWELMKSSQEDYRLPVSKPVFSERVEFGVAIKEKHFFLDKDWTYLNHGAFGATLKEGLQVEQAWQVHCERQPSRYFDREFLNHMAYALKRLAKFVDADPTDLAFVHNATAGSSTVINEMVKTFKPGDSILTLDTAYGSVKMQLDKANKENDVPVEEVLLKFPINSPDEILITVRNALKPHTKLAVFDHVCSSHAVTLPVKELVSICHEREIPVLIDGAHCLGSHPISMRDIDADFYVANGHKWLCAVKGCAFLYVAKKYQSQIRPLVTAWGYNNGFSAEFNYAGTIDYTPYFSITTNFWEFYGPQNIREYIYKLAREAGKLLKEAWGTGLLADPSMFGTMVLVELPDGLLPQDSSTDVRVEPPYDDKSADKLQDILHFDYKVEVPVKSVEGKLYVRISAHVYNEMGDYERLAEAVLEQQRNVLHANRN